MVIFDRTTKPAFTAAKALEFHNYKVVRTPPTAHNRHVMHIRSARAHSCFGARRCGTRAAASSG